MARLNEPAAPIETIESLKRRFMRQNRDIARANSTQSLRIRNLENETSRLLAENLGLREQILKLQNEVENGQAQQLANHTGAVKLELGQKLLEIGALINSLGEDTSRRTKAPRSGKITRSSLSQSPNQKNWRDMCNSAASIGGDDGRLPPILENKSYPRRTLDQQELSALLSDPALDSTDSPDIGPPPVSQFVDEDPVKIDLPLRQRKKDCEESPDPEPTLSSHLEQRKKRKDNTSISETMSTSKSDQTMNIRDGASTLKSGAKRKLSVREDEEREPIVKAVDDAAEDFKFTRGVSEERTRTKPGMSAEKPALKTTRELAIARGVPRDKQSATIVSARKVLAPKSVNNSPKKNSRTQLVEDAKAAKSDQSKVPSASERHREKRKEPVSIASFEPAPALDTIEVQPEPETPAGLDIFSLPSSQPSTARTESRDTPPPGELGQGNEGQRPSRRARGAVSYAEPNLRDKMRRPTKELIDAVAAGEKANRKSFIKQEEEINSEAVKIKTEPEADDDWRRMPPASSSTVENSPLSGKTFIGETLPSSITTHRKRRESILQQAAPELPRSSSANAVSALLAGNRKAKADVKDKGLENVNLTSKAGDTDIYDFRGSSPLTKGDASVREALSKKDKEEKPIARSSRRNSQLSRDMNLISDSEASDIEASRKPEGLSTRRRQSSLGLRASAMKPSSVTGDNGDKTLKKATVTTGMAGLGVDGNRSDRIAARRRSMML